MAGRSLEQCRAQALFQLLNPAAECGLRQVQGLGRTVEAAQVGHRDEGPQIEKLEVHALSPLRR
jgi:hypothetical protein